MKTKFLLFALMISAFTSLSYAQISGVSGSGTQLDPYLIGTPSDLIAAKTAANTSPATAAQTAYYQLTADIDMSASGNFNNFGSSTIPFKGNFNGNGHKISGIITGTSSSRYSNTFLGFFGYIDGATISNLSVDVSYYLTNIAGANAGASCAGLVSIVNGTGNTLINNCHVTGTIDAESTGTAATALARAGGILCNPNSTNSATITIINSTVNASVKATNTATGTTPSAICGGIVGETKNTVYTLNIVNCSASGLVSAVCNTGNSIAGGISSFFTGTNPTVNILNCLASNTVYSSGYVTAGNNKLPAAGIAQVPSTGSTIKYCIALNPSISGVNTSTGATTYGWNRVYSVTTPSTGNADFNYAKADMTVQSTINGVGPTAVTLAGKTITGKDGADLGGTPETEAFSKLNTYVNANPTYSGIALKLWGDVPITSDANISSYFPTSETNVTVTSGKLTIDANTTVKSITVAPSAKITVTGLYTLTTTNGITLQSNSTATATLVDNYENPTITATVQQYLPQGRNWYLGSPIETNIASNANLTTAGATSVSYYSEQNGWQHLYTGNLAEGVGYVAVSAAGSNTTKISFTGKLNSGDVPVTLTKKGSTFIGYNLIANPYPSYINPMPAINANTNLDGTIWYRTRKTVAPYEYKFETVNTTSGVGTNAAGTGMVTGYIPPMQAFWVKTNVDMQSFTFTNSMRDHARNVTVGAGTVPTTPLKAKKQESISLARLVVTGNAGSDEAVLYIDANASNSFDKYDSRKMFESTSATTPEIYTSVGDEKLVINGLNSIPYDVEIPLGFIAKQTGDYSISRSEMTNFEVGTRIVLKDKLQPTTEIELGEGTSYNFSSQTATTDRFSLVFRAPGVTTGVDNAVKPNAQVYVNAANQITIIAPEKCIYAVYNAMGQQIENGILKYKLHTVNCKLNTGVYFVSLSVNGQSVIQKVIIR